MLSREEIVHDILSIANWCEDQAASSALEDLARQAGNMRCEDCDSKDKLLKEMAEAFSQIVAEVKKYAYHPSLEHIGPLVLDGEEVLQKYYEQEETNAE